MVSPNPQPLQRNRGGAGCCSQKESGGDPGQAQFPAAGPLGLLLTSEPHTMWICLLLPSCNCTSSSLMSARLLSLFVPVISSAGRVFQVYTDGTDLPLSRANSAGRGSESHTDTNITVTAQQRDAKTWVISTEQNAGTSLLRLWMGQGFEVGGWSSTASAKPHSWELIGNHEFQTLRLLIFPSAAAESLMRLWALSSSGPTSLAYF